MGKYVQQLNYDNMIHLLLHLISIINHSLKEISKNSMLPLNVDLKELYPLIMEKETWDEAQQTLKEMFKDLSALRKDHSSDQTHSILVDTIKDMIENRYPDPDLSLPYIASKLGMSTTHISKIFREREQTPINEYINDIRLHHARLLLENFGLTVNEIMARVGFGNQSYFFKLFKKKYGATPKEYRTKKNVM
ncbi:helix-turn-helix transcriptional regulator [Saccharibacillus brassicae]|uniref:Helix-turn-helix transcriptional regulator n=1 Tax=Saccharibacillus brassicae TaxID=2583377 RepID=A0A4Y6V122_SACBS|nr:AraC family transcriptional regulator [Saccharibacillus brassicae]QDH23074.1 helix-turn-helix transcriptional regulator [Saccharibacillus brassicae]